MPKLAKRVRLPPAPVYVSLSAIMAVIAVLRDHGTPYPIDEIAVQHVSSSMRRQVLSGLRFLRLIDARGRALPGLKSLVVAYETPAWPTVLTSVLKVAYEPLFQHDLGTMSPTVFQRLFRSQYPSTDGVTRKAITFFISAARSAQIPLNGDLFEGRRVRRGGEKQEALDREDGDCAESIDRVQVDALSLAESGSEESPGKVIAADDGRAALAFLTDLLDEDRMTGEEQEAVWTLVKYVRRCRDPERRAA